MSDRREDERQIQSDDRDDDRDGEREVRRLLEASGPRESLPEEDLAQLRRQARESWRAEVVRDVRRRRISPRAAVLALAAALIAVAGIASWWALRTAPPSIEPVGRVLWTTGGGTADEPALHGRILPSGTALVTAPSGFPRSRLVLRLESGAEIRLDHSTSVVLASATALELEQGAVYVDTGEGEDGRGGIEVRTPLGTARDVGTRFVVRYTVEDGPVLLVRVREGEVALQAGDRYEETRAGTELVTWADGRLERRPAPRFGESWEWVLGAAPPFVGRSVGDLLRWVSRETGWVVRFADAELAARVDRVTLHGTTGDLAPDEAAFVVLPAAGLRGELRKGTLFVDEAE